MEEYKSVFSKRIRIRKAQLEWLRKNKDTRTMAGFLDIIINNYKDEQLSCVDGNKEIHKKTEDD